MVFVKTDDDGILTNVYIKVIDKAEEVTPGTPAVVVSTIEATADTNMIKAINVVCSDNVTSNTKVSVSLQVLNNAGTWTTLKTLTFNIAAGSKWDTAPQTVTGLAGGQYKLVCGTVEKLVTVA